MVEDLVRRGLVERKRMDSDRRTYRLNLTPAGKKVLRSDDALRAPARTQPGSIIGERDRKQFIRILKRIAAEIE